MDEAVGTIFIFSVGGIIFGDAVGRKIGVWMLIGSLIVAFIISPAFAVALVLAPLAIGIMAISGIVAFIKRL